MANFLAINGTVFDARVAITELTETFDVLDGENTGRVMSGLMIRDIIGTYIGHEITLYNTNNDEFDALWDFLVEHSVDDSVYIEAADGQSSISYQAYYTSGSRSIYKVENGVTYWDKISVTFVSMTPQVRP